MGKDTLKILLPHAVEQQKDLPYEITLQVFAKFCQVLRLLYLFLEHSKCVALFKNYTVKCFKYQT